MNNRDRFSSAISARSIVSDFEIIDVIDHAKDKFLYKIKDLNTGEYLYLLEFLSVADSREILNAMRARDLNVERYFAANGVSYLVLQATPYLPLKEFYSAALLFPNYLESIGKYVINFESKNGSTVFNVGIIRIELEADFDQLEYKLQQLVDEINDYIYNRIESLDLQIQSQLGSKIIDVRKGSIVIDFGIFVSIIGAVSLFFKEYPSIKAGFEEFKKDLETDSQKWMRIIRKHTAVTRIKSIEMNLVEKDMLEKIYDFQSKKDGVRDT